MTFTESRILRRELMAENMRRALDRRADRWAAVSTERLELEIHSRSAGVQRELEEAIKAAPSFWKRRVARWDRSDFLRHVSQATGRDDQIGIAERWMHLSPEDIT